jgi:hypothetical protein
MVWGSEDFVSLTKEITSLDGCAEFPTFQTRGGVMDGEHLSAERVKAVSLWPSRQEQIRILLGQILSPGAKLASQLLAPGRSLASQIKEKAKDEAGEDADSKSEEKGDAISEPKVEAAVEPKVEAAVEPKVEAAVEPKVEAAVEPKVEAPAETTT